MGLSSEIVSQFAKLVKAEPQKPTESTLYGEMVEYEGSMWVRLDGSDRLTPVSSTVSTQNGDKVTVMIKDHSAVVTGNLTSPSASSGDVEKVATKISEFEIIAAYKVTTEELEAIDATIENLKAKTASIDNLEAVYAEIETLQAKFANLDSVTAKDAEILNAEIENLRAKFAEFDDISTEDLEAINAEIDNLKGYTADFTYVSADVLTALKASINELDVKKLSADFANIDFANIDKANIYELYATSGIIENITSEDGVFTGQLVGVTIKGDIIEGGTVVADKLVVKGEDGLYYKLNTDGVTTEAEQTDYNSLNGSVITAKSITATKISVSDLVAFDATIGGFKITDTSIYSGVKETLDNETKGVYLDNDGQFALGDDEYYLRYYKDTDEDGNEIYRLAISAESIMFGGSSKTTAADLKSLTEHVKIGTYIDPETENEQPCVELSEGDSDFKMRLTNTNATFIDGDVEGTVVDADGVETGNVTVNGEFRQGGYVWAVRANGNYGLMWKGDA